MESAVTSPVVDQTPVHSDAGDTASGGELSAALAELEETTARVVSLRQKVERLTTGLAERQNALHGLERELSTARVAADHDRATISRLEREVEGRDEVLGHLRTELTELAGELGVSQAMR